MDLTLTLDGTPFALGTHYDHFTDAPGGALESTPSVERSLRRLLAATLGEAGFAPYSLEWRYRSSGDRWSAAETGTAGTLDGPLNRPHPAW